MSRNRKPSLQEVGSSPVITYNGHPVKIVQVWPGRNVIGEMLLTVKSLRTDLQWDVWGFELTGSYGALKQGVERATKQY